MCSPVQNVYKQQYYTTVCGRVGESFKHQTSRQNKPCTADDSTNICGFIIAKSKNLIGFTSETPDRSIAVQRKVPPTRYTLPALQVQQGLKYICFFSLQGLFLTNLTKIVPCVDLHYTPLFMGASPWFIL